MTGYPWDGVANRQLFYADLNAAFANAYAQAASALAMANTAQATATVTAGLVAAPKPVGATVNWSGAVRPGTYVLSGTLPYNLLVSSVDASIGSNGGALTAQFRANGITIGSLGAIVVTQSVKTNFPAVTGPGNPVSIAAGSLIDLVVSVSGGAPADSYLCLNGTHT